jgi:hypothetical protein
MNLCNRDMVWLGTLIVLGALLGVLYLWVWLRTLRAKGVPALWRWLTFVPLMAPVAAFRAGFRVPAVLWFVVLIAYLVLRSFS